MIPMFTPGRSIPMLIWAWADVSEKNKLDSAMVR